MIARIRERAGGPHAVAGPDGVVLGIGDDAAVLSLPPDRQLVVAMDTLNTGVHFPHDTAPADIGWKALAVNLSDLAAMGATPAWCTLSLSLPAGDRVWIDAFLDGFLGLAEAHRTRLVGGDTTRGPLSVCVTVHGLVAPGAALRRDGAQAGDDIWISGTPGDAAGALAQWKAGAGGDAALRARLDRPTPRTALGIALIGVAHAAIDVSDGLLADLQHLAGASGLAARIDLGALPVSPALRAAFGDDVRYALQATGGDDYELCFAAPSAARAAVIDAGRVSATPVTRIGQLLTGSGVSAWRGDVPWTPPSRGWDHFGRGEAD
nr:thiamine-phosphate kinase [Luteimonas deserti]